MVKTMLYHFYGYIAICGKNMKMWREVIEAEFMSVNPSGERGRGRKDLRRVHERLSLYL